MKTFHVKYAERGSWGFYMELDCIAINDTEQGALADAKRMYPEYEMERCWSIEEICNTKPGVHYVTSASS